MRAAHPAPPRSRRTPGRLREISFRWDHSLAHFRSALSLGARRKSAATLASGSERAPIALPEPAAALAPAARVPGWPRAPRGIPRRGAGGLRAWRRRRCCCCSSRSSGALSRSPQRLSAVIRQLCSSLRIRTATSSPNSCSSRRLPSVSDQALPRRPCAPDSSAARPGARKLHIAFHTPLPTPAQEPRRAEVPPRQLPRPPHRPQFEPAPRRRAALERPMLLRALRGLRPDLPGAVAWPAAARPAAMPAVRSALPRPSRRYRPTNSCAPGIVRALASPGSPSSPRLAFSCSGPTGSLPACFTSRWASRSTSSTPACLRARTAILRYLRASGDL